MNGAHFNLRSWASTSSQLIDQVSRDKISDTNNSVNILGLQWTTKADTLSLTSKSSIPSIASLITTSKVLKESSNVFDPLGLLSPVTVKVKIFMQSLWQCNLDWDELLSNEDQQQWLSIAENIQEARCLKNSRQYFSTVADTYTYFLMRVSQLMVPYPSFVVATKHHLLWQSPG